MTSESDRVERVIAGKHVYHRRSQCAGAESERISLITATRRNLSACGKCNPPPAPIEYAVCEDCGWYAPVDECERTRGYRGACPGCGSPRTTSEFDEPDAGHGLVGDLREEVTDNAE